MTLAELQRHASGARVLLAVAGFVHDVTGVNAYAPEGQYALFAGQDITRCLGVFSIDPDDLNDLSYVRGT